MRAWFRYLGAATLMCAVAACAPDFNPPPDYKGGYLMNSDQSRTVTVESGDTLYTVAQRYDVPTKVIADRNGLKPPYQLTVGQTLILDPTKIHTIAQGDTLASVARTYGIDQTVLASENGLAPPYKLEPGTELWIPDPITSVASAQPAPIGTVSAAPLPLIQTAPNNTRPITSETLAPAAGSLTPPVAVPAPQAPTASAQAAADEPLSKPIAVQPVPTPFVPQPAEPVASSAAPTPVTAPPAVVFAPVPSASAQVAPVQAAPSQPAPPPSAPAQTAAIPAAPPVTAPAPIVPATTPPAAQQALAIPTARAGTHFAWPVTGKIIAKFGPSGKGLHNDGINIAAPVGTQVYAADNGVVAYAGNELKGFGNLLLIKHADGWTTAYAHNEKLLVARGETVAQGQVIATVGRTGNVDTPQLHFEVRKGTQAMDPLDYLEKSGG